MEYSVKGSPTIYGPEMRVDRTQPMVNYMLNSVYPCGMQRGPPLSENQMYSPIGQIQFPANATPNYSGMQLFQVGGAEVSQLHIHCDYDMHAAHRDPRETTDTKLSISNPQHH
jgi:hypothetical protein